MRGVFSRVLPLCGLGFALAAGWSTPASATIDFRGFGDISCTSRSADDVTGSNNGCAVGQLDLYASTQVDNHTDVLLELVIEETADGHFVSDLERLQATYQFNNVHRLRAGRFHSILGYWNRAYHHGSHLHTTAFRPFFLEFEDEGGVLPTHAVGLWWNGRWNGRSGKLETGLMVHNGASIKYDSSGTGYTGILDPGTGGDRDNPKTVAAMVAWHPAHLQGLEVGLSGQAGKVVITDEKNSPGPVIRTEVDQYITAAHLAWLGEQTEFLAEVFNWDHDAGGTTSDARAWYVQGGGRVGKNMLYMRYETLEADKDIYFNSLGFTSDPGVGAYRQHTVGTLGLRVDLSDSSALKFEMGQVDDDLQGTYDTGAVQWSFAF